MHVKLLLQCYHNEPTFITLVTPLNHKQDHIIVSKKIPL